MAKEKATDALRRLNLEFGCAIGYPRFHRDIVSGLIPAERAPDGRSWEIEEDDLPGIAARLRAATVRRSAA